ncbi:MAG: ectoine hydroxylase [Planctomycetaceae bacterium]|nr:ectoine hydroxylase [Planctomycetaceae bacterium]
MNEITADPYYSRTSDSWQAAPRLDPTTSDAPGPLTTDEVWNYAHSGFLFAQGLFTQEEIDELLAEANSLSENWPADRPGIVREPGTDVVRSIFRLHKISKRYEQLFSDERLIGRVRQLLGADVYIHQSRVNYKPALNGKEFFWHSDFETWHVEDGLPRMRTVSCSLLLDENYEFNAPLMLLPGSHRQYVTCIGEAPANHYQSSLKQQKFGVPDPDSLTRLVNEHGITQATGPAGSLLLFDCNTMHGSNGNITPFPRSNLFFVYNSIWNQLVRPFCHQKPRPEFIASREFSSTMKPREFI